LSLVECVNVVMDTMEWKNIETMKANGVQWLQSNRVKAFYSVTRDRFDESAEIVEKKLYL
jgi:hypothetical protein